MRDKFMRNYPGELLGPSVSPSLSFLQLLKDKIDNGALSWILWKSRTSESIELEYLERRRPRSDGQLLRSLLSADNVGHEDGPEAQVMLSGNPELVLSKVQQLLSNALAMLDEAHLLVLKRYHQRFLELAVQKPMDGSLRAPNLSEILSADRAGWMAVSQLNDSLNEVAFCRHDFHIALQPRLIGKSDRNDHAPAKRQPHPFNSSNLRRGQRSRLLPSAPLAMGQNQGHKVRLYGKTAGLRSCPLAKGSAIAKGEACGGNHKASAHANAPH